MQEKNGIFFNFFKIKIFAKTIDKSLIFGYNVFRCLQNKKYISKKHAEVAELADAHGSGPCGRNTLWVRLPSSALTICRWDSHSNEWLFFYSPENTWTFFSFLIKYIYGIFCHQN